MNNCPQYLFSQPYPPIRHCGLVQYSLMDEKAWNSSKTTHQQEQKHCSTLSNSIECSKRSWSDYSHKEDDEQMTGDDSSSCGSVLEMRSLKRLRIEDNPILLSHHTPSSQPQQLQNHLPTSSSYQQSFLPSTAIAAFKNSTSFSSKQHSAFSFPSISPSKKVREMASGDENAEKPFNGSKSMEIAHSLDHVQNSQGVPNYNSLQISNHMLRDLHLERQRRRLQADDNVGGKRGFAHSTSHENVEEFKLSSASALHHARQQQEGERNVPKWKRQIRLHSNSQLY